MLGARCLEASTSKSEHKSEQDISVSCHKVSTMWQIHGQGDAEGTEVALRHYVAGKFLVSSRRAYMSYMARVIGVGIDKKYICCEIRRCVQACVW